VEPPAPVATGRGGGRGIGTRSGRESTYHRAIGGGTIRHRGGASVRDGDTPSALEEEEAGILQFEVSHIFARALLIRGAVAYSFDFLLTR
jgi:hypothetical protein